MEKYYDNTCIEAGVDEAGRGCLAGPVYAAAVILPKDFPIAEINDSKKLSEKKRISLRLVIEKYSVWAVATSSPQEIDEINILRASILAMHRALDMLEEKPNHIIVDGNRFYDYHNIKHTCIVKGDGKYESIGAASILAKTHRDEYMKKLHDEYPQYCWDANKGYPTSAHREAIIKHGVTDFHRKTFSLLSKQLKIKL